VSILTNAKAVQITAENLLYAGYAQHFLMTYYPAAYPRWYLDGFGQIFGTMAVKGDTIIEFGRAPDGANMVMHEFGPYPIKDVLDDSYLTERPHKTGWTPIHAWALTHFLFFSDTRRPQLRQYLTARADGKDAATAAQIFGDQKALSQEMRSYFYHRKPYLQISYDPAKIEQPIVRRLRESEAAFVKGRLELGARVELPPLPAADAGPEQARILTRARQEALRLRTDWLADLRRDAAHYPNELEAQLLLAEAECRSDNGAQCVSAAEEALAFAPDNSAALAWKGSGQAQLALAAPTAQRAALLRSARRTIAQANRADSENPLPLLAFYRSFAEAGETPPDIAIEGLMKAVDSVPAAPGPRLMLGEALVRRGNAEAARRALIPVANGAYASPEGQQARMLLSTLGN
jgi:hypothetical protein